MADVIQGINTPTTIGTDHPSIMDPDMEDISADHSLIPIPTITEAAVVEGTPHTLLPATAAACTTFQPMDDPMTPHTLIVAPLPTLSTSPADVTNTTPLTTASLTPTNPTPQCKDLSSEESSNAQDLQFPIHPTAPKWSLSRIPPSDSSSDSDSDSDHLNY